MHDDGAQPLNNEYGTLNIRLLPGSLIFLALSPIGILCMGMIERIEHGEWRLVEDAGNQGIVPL